MDRVLCLLPSGKQTSVASEDLASGQEEGSMKERKPKPKGSFKKKSTSLISFFKRPITFLSPVGELENILLNSKIILRLSDSFYI